MKPTDSIFFYLDAHADDDYPLEEEIKFITKNYNNFLILIDDFEVQTKKIMDFLEIKWNPNIKNYRETALSRMKINTPIPNHLKSVVLAKPPLFDCSLSFCAIITRKMTQSNKKGK